MHTKNKMSFSIVLLTVMAITTLPPMAETDSTDLTRVQTAYNAEIQKIESLHTAKIISLQKQYSSGLENILQDNQKKGELDNVLEIKKEIDMVNKEPETLNTAPESPISQVNNLRNAYLKKIEEYTVARAKSILTLTNKYEAGLSELQTELTRKGEIEEALLVKTERESLSERPYVLEAEIIMKDFEARQAELAAQAAEEEPEEEKTVKTLPSILTRKESDETIIKKRFDEVCDLIQDQDWEAASEYVDPEFVEKAGEEGVERALQGSMQFLQLIERNPATKLKVGDVEVDKEDDSAVLYPKVWFNNKWIETDTVKWILVEDQWYIKTGAPSKTNTKDTTFPIRPPRKR